MTVFPISEEPLKRSLREAGIRISEREEEIDIVIASYDRGFEYRKLQIAFDAIWCHKRARLVTTNPDPYCPIPGGRSEPEAAIESVSLFTNDSKLRIHALLGEGNNRGVVLSTSRAFVGKLVREIAELVGYITL